MLFVVIWRHLLLSWISFRYTSLLFTCFPAFCLLQQNLVPSHCFALFFQQVYDFVVREKHTEKHTLRIPYHALRTEKGSFELKLMNSVKKLQSTYARYLWSGRIISYCFPFHLLIYCSLMCLVPLVVKTLIINLISGAKH